ncbi:hypothetical protein D3C76_1040790 [compost metagenome]
MSTALKWIELPIVSLLAFIGAWYSLNSSRLSEPILHSQPAKSATTPSPVQSINMSARIVMTVSALATLHTIADICRSSLFNTS